MSTTAPPAPVTAEQTTDDAPGTGISQIVSFRLANEEYGLDIMKVQEIILIGPVTEMPQVPEYMRGLINLRGHVIPIVDLRVRLGLEAAEATEHTRILVLNVGNRTIGVVVDAVDEVLRVDSVELEPTPVGVSGVGEEYVAGLLKFEDKLLILLNLERIVEEEAATASSDG